MFYIDIHCNLFCTAEANEVLFGCDCFFPLKLTACHLVGRHVENRPGGP